MKRPDILVFSRSNDGHRGEYERVMIQVLNEIGLTGHVIRQFTPALFRSNVVFLMIEESPILFSVICVLSIFTRSNLFGLLFRPLQSFGKSTKQKIKYHLLCNLKRLDTLTICSILPHWVDRRLMSISNCGIYEPQCWDLSLSDTNYQLESSLSSTVRANACGRVIVIAIGGQNRNKGFPQFCEMWRKMSQTTDKFYFVVAGKIDPILSEAAREFVSTGGFLCDRKLTEAEIYSLYGIADCIWSAYSPSYDQSSGIAGRAFQFGKTILVRKGSLIAKLYAGLNHHTIDIDWNNISPSPLMEECGDETMRKEISTELLENMRRELLAALCSRFLL